MARTAPPRVSEMMTVTDFAAAAGCNASALRRRVSRGEFPGATKVGTQWLIPGSLVGGFARKPSGRPRRAQPAQPAQAALIKPGRKRDRDGTAPVGSGAIEAAG